MERNAWVQEGVLKNPLPDFQNRKIGGKCWLHKQTILKSFDIEDYAKKERKYVCR